MPLFEAVGNMQIQPPHLEIRMIRDQGQPHCQLEGTLFLEQRQMEVLAQDTIQMALQHR